LICGEATGGERLSVQDSRKEELLGLKNTHRKGYVRTAKGLGALQKILEPQKRRPRERKKTTLLGDSVPFPLLAERRDAEK